MNKLLKALLAALCIFVLFNSCEVGLGSAVDTQPPSLEISYPPTDSVIRQSFVMNGDCSDETSIRSVQVVLTEIENSANSISYEATVNNIKKTWTVTINTPDAETGKFPVPDGSYEVSVTATDNGSRTTTKSRTLKIDNTAPVLVLQNPSSTVSDSSPNLFGKSIKVVGSLSDDNSVDNLTFSAYDNESGDLLGSKTVSQVPQSVNLIIGTYSKPEDSDYDASDLYQTIYTGSSTAQKNYKFKISVSDEARIYDKVTRTDERGNVCSGYYLYDSIYSSVLTKVTYKELYNLFKETGIYPALLVDSSVTDEVISERISTLKTQLKADKASLSDSDIDTLVNALKSDYIPTAESSDLKGTFALKPDNSPSWSVLGLSAWKENNWGQYTYQTTNSLTIQYAVGLGNTPLDTDSIGLKLVYVKEDGTQETSSAKYPSEVVIFKSAEDIVEDIRSSYSDKSEAELLEIAKAQQTSDGLFTSTNTVYFDKTNLQVKFSLDSSKYSSDSIKGKIDMTKGHYQIVLTGKDQDGNNFNNAETYCFMYSQSMTAPTLTVSSPSSSNIYVSGIKEEGSTAKISQTFTGTSSSACSTTLNLKAQVDGTDLTDSTAFTYTPSAITTDDDGNSSRTWTYVLYPEYAFSSQTVSKTYEVKLVLTDGNGSTDFKQFQIYYDVQKPGLSMEISTLVENSTRKDNVNGEITAKITYTDDDIFNKGQIKAVAASGGTDYYFKPYYVSNSSNVYVEPETELTTINEFKTFYIDTTTAYTRSEIGGTVTYTAASAPDNVSLVVTASTIDRSGNKTECAETVYINQSTDKPTVSFSNMTSGGDYKKNLFGLGSDTIYCTAKDDDSISTIVYKIYDVASDDTKTLYSTTTLSSVNSSSKSMEIDLANLKDDGGTTKTINAGKHVIEVVVTDKNGTTNSTCSEKFGYDSDQPVITIDYSKTYAPAALNLEISASDSNGIEKIEDIDTADNNSKVSGTITYNSDSGKWIAVINSTVDGTYTHNFKATDTFGRTKTAGITFTVDSVAPVFLNSGTDLIKISGNGKETGTAGLTTTWFDTTALKISGKVTETNLASLSLVVDGTTNVAMTATSPYAVTNDFGNGTHSFQLIAKDEAGNETKTSLFYVNTDSLSPVISSVNLKNTAGSIASDAVINTNALTAEINAYDATSGITKIEVFKDSTYKESLGASTTAIAASSTAVKTSIEITVPAANTSYTFAVKVTDSAGNVTTGEFVNFNYDNQKPSVTFDSPVLSSINKNVVLSGTISDSNINSSNVPVLYYKQGAADWAAVQKSDGNNVAVTVSTDSSSGITTWTSGSIDTTAFSDSTDITFTLDATDKAGNSSKGVVTKTYRINQDGDRPEITLSNINTDSDNPTTLSSGTLKGTITDDDGTDLEMFIQVVKDGSTYSETAPTAANAGSWTKLTVDESKNWSYDVTTGDGNYKVYFYVKDAAGTAFYKTDSIANVKYPKVYYDTNAAVSDAVSFSIDVQPPSIDSFEYAVPATNTATTDDEDYITASFNTVIGGPNKPYVQFRVKASDTVLTDASKLTVKMTFLDDSTRTLTYNDDGYFYSTVISVGSASGYSGQYYAMVNAYDKSATPKTQTVNFVVDNSVPSGISNISPASTEEITDKISMSGMCSDETTANSGVVEIWYTIPMKGTLKGSAVNETTASSLADSRWTRISDEGNTSSLNSWKYVISADSLVDTSSAILSQYSGHTHTTSGIYTLPVWFKLVDKAGNIGYITTNSFRYNPDADKPIVSINYPDPTGTEGKTGTNSSGASFNYVILGGTIRISGGATDNESVSAVYLQFDMNGDGYWECGYPGTDYGYSSTATAVTGCPFAASAVTAIPTLTGEYGILATGTASWSYSLKLSDLGNGLLYSDTNKKVLGIRAIAIDNGGGNDSEKLAGNFSEPVYVSVNNGIPAFGTAEVRWYESADAAGTESTVATKTQDYTSDMYLSGNNWYLCVPVTSTAGFASTTPFEYTFNKGTDTTSGIKVIAVDGDTNKSKELRIPVTASSSWDIQIIANDASAKYNKSEYAVNIDNVAPAFPDSDIYSTVTASSGSVKLYSNAYGTTKGKVINKSETNYSKIADNDNAFKLIGKVSDSGSGVDKVMFYFKRTGTTNRVYTANVKYDSSKYSAGNKLSSRVDIDNTTATAANGKVYINAEGLPALYLTGVTRSTVYKIQSDSLKSDVNIGACSYVKIGGVYRIIKTFDATTGTIELADACSKTYTSVEIIYAAAIDKHEGNASSDDGDGIIEELSASGTSVTWAATITSGNIPDGPVQVHAVCFDAAGNSCHYYAVSEISNSAPRITRVKLGTDLNQNGKYDSAEFETYYAITNNDGTHDLTTGKEVWNLDTTSGSTLFQVKKNLAVIPEFVGGNPKVDSTAKTTGFVYGFSKNASAGITSPESGSTAIKTTESTVLSGATDFGFTTGNNGGVFVVSNSTLGTTVDDSDFYYRFSFWDSTEETNAGTDSQWTILNAKVHQHLVDKTPPTATINPFYWNSSSDNSLYGSSSSNGHIELESDWKLSDGYLKDDSGNAKTAATSGEFDADPKVSGKVVLTGTAYDETCLSKLVMTISKFNLGSTLSAGVDIATYSTSTSTWTFANGPVSGTAGGVLASDGWHFEITNTDNTPTQSGHTVTWKLELDSTFVSSASVSSGTVTKLYTANDVVVTVVAYDTSTNKTGGNNSSYTSGTNTAAGALNGYYRMDVVPYVVKVETNLSKQKKSNWSVYNRSALGHYPVQSVVSNVDDDILNTTTSEDVTLHGFNLNGSTVVINSSIGTANNSGTDTTKQVTVTAPTDTALAQLKFNVANLASGKLTPTVNGISVLNNYNYNASMGAATEAGTANVNKYNMQGNGDTNNLLTDDLVFDVWEFDDRAAIPINGLATGVQMQVNQYSHMLNFAFANGGLFYSMGDSTYSSRYWAGDWDTFAGPCVGLGVDSLGYTYSVDSGGDTNESGSADKYVFYTSRWGRGLRSQRGTYNEKNDSGFNALRMEEIALKTGSGTFDYSLMKYRYLSSEFATSVSGSTTNLYLVNYDALTDEIRFRAGSTSSTSYAFSGSNSTSNFGGFNDTYNSGTPSNYATAYCQVIANNSSADSTFVGNGATTTVSAITDRGAGQYVDIAIAKNSSSKDVACVVWFDAYDNCLKYTYYVDPITNWNSLKGNRTAAGWSEPVTIFSEGGEYCHIAVDANNHIHIAAYAGNGDVKYAYLASYNSTYDESTNSCTVDASGSVGEHLTLDVALDSSGNSIPYIGYFTSAIKAPKYAYLVDTTDTNHVPEGVDDNERFTGAWEVTVVPTPSRLTTNREDKVNIGVFKTTAGVLNYSTTDGKAPVTSGTSNIGTNYCSTSVNGYSSTEESKCYGNGSKNAVFAYQISGGTGSCIETAQIR